jgi:hypothetical protein
LDLYKLYVSQYEGIAMSCIFRYIRYIRYIRYGM